MTGKVVDKYEVPPSPGRWVYGGKYNHYVAGTPRRLVVVVKHDMHEGTEDFSVAAEDWHRTKLGDRVEVANGHVYPMDAPRRTPQSEPLEPEARR